MILAFDRVKMYWTGKKFEHVLVFNPESLQQHAVEKGGYGKLSGTGKPYPAKAEWTVDTCGRYTRLNNKGIFPDIRVLPPEAEDFILRKRLEIAKIELEMKTFADENFLTWPQFLTHKDAQKIWEESARKKHAKYPRLHSKTIEETIAWSKNHHGKVLVELGVKP